MSSSLPCHPWTNCCDTLTHWGWVTHICVSELTIIVSDYGLSPGWHQAIIWTNAWILLIGPLGTNFSEILIEIHTFSFKKVHFKMSSGKCWPFCLGLNVLLKCSMGCTQCDHRMTCLLLEEDDKVHIKSILMTKIKVRMINHICNGQE